MGEKPLVQDIELAPLLGAERLVQPRLVVQGQRHDPGMDSAPARAQFERGPATVGPVGRPSGSVPAAAGSMRASCLSPWNTRSGSMRR